MNILQKKAWTNLAVVTGAVVITGILLCILVRVDADGSVFGLVFALPVGIITGLIIYIRSLSTENKLDEREKMISLKAFAWASYTFVLFVVLASFVIFEISGARSRVPVYLLPLIVLTGLFLAQLVESAGILIQFAREQHNE